MSAELGRDDLADRCGDGVDYEQWLPTLNSIIEEGALRSKEYIHNVGLTLFQIYPTFWKKNQQKHTTTESYTHCRVKSKYISLVGTF